VNKDEVKRLEEELERAQAAVTQHAADRVAAEKRLKEIAARNYSDDLAFRTIKSTFDAKRFEYEEARDHHAPDADPLKEAMEHLNARLEDLRVKLQEEDKARAEVEAILKGITG